jgi:hypothetical protein
LRTLKWFEPSFGLNISYVDFSKQRDIEVGVGGVVGLFRNKVFFSSGINLNTPNKHNSYFAIGFSFTSLATKLVEAKGGG